MPDKRKTSMQSPAPKRPRLHEGSGNGAPHAQEQPRSHPMYGQKNAFPGLDDAGDELFYGPADDGMEYLRMVRSEANAMPSLFIAQDSKHGANDTKAFSSDSDRQKSSFPAGFYADEAFIAPNEEIIVSPGNIYPEAQDSYYNLLRHRFMLLRSTLKCTPPATAIAGLDDSHPISLPRNNAPARKEWRRLTTTVDPQMVQIACMDSESVLRVLQVIARGLSDNVRSGDAADIRRLGAWAWGLLGKCREVGELSTDEVGEIRDLGKRAARILEKIQEAEQVEDEEEGEEPGEGEEAEEVEGEKEISADFKCNEKDGKEEPEASEINQQPEEPSDTSGIDMSAGTDESDELAAAKERLQARLQEEEKEGKGKENLPDDSSSGDNLVKQTRAMLDMIITVVGEFFGQRDLLEAREVWAGPSTP